MNKQEVLKKIIQDFGMYSLANKLELDTDKLQEKDINIINNHREKLSQEGIETILTHPQLKNHILSEVFSLECKSLMQNHVYFLTNPNVAYEQLYCILNDEKSINKIFTLVSKIMNNTDASMIEYRDRVVKFLGVVVNKSKNQDNIVEMFSDFVHMEKTDQTDFFPLIKEFLNKNILADKIYESIQSLDNAYLETRLVDYLYEKRIAFSFKLKNIGMFETAESIVFEKSIKFNTNFFMKLGLKEDNVIESLETLADLLCNVDGINYLLKRKDKALNLILRSTNENKVNEIYQQIIKAPDMIKEFVQGFNDTEEYKKRFLTYWYLNDKLSTKKEGVKIKI